MAKKKRITWACHHCKAGGFTYRELEEHRKSCKPYLKRMAELDEFEKWRKQGICRGCHITKAPKEGWFWRCKDCGTMNPPYYSERTIQILKGAFLSLRSRSDQ